MHGVRLSVDLFLPLIVPGAGTTREKQFYTYTDTTAQPNVVYYYRVEDVSLDGDRQTLTRGIRLKGYVGAAGKATMLWAELETQELSVINSQQSEE